MRYSLPACEPLRILFCILFRRPHARLLPALLLLCSLPAFAAEKGHSPLEAAVPIAIDVGHSLERGGATSARGKPEYSFNLELAQQILDTLHGDGLSGSFLIAPGQRHMSPAARTRLARSKGAVLLLSVHHDSVQPRYLEAWTFEGRALRHSDRFQGYSLFYSEKNPVAAASLGLAKDIGAALRLEGFTPTAHHAEPIEGENREFVDPERGVYRFDDLLVLKTAEMPAVLLEAGVILNRIEERALSNPARQKRMARAVSAGIRRHLGLEQRPASGPFAAPAPSP